MSLEIKKFEGFDKRKIASFEVSKTPEGLTKVMIDKIKSLNIQGVEEFYKINIHDFLHTEGSVIPKSGLIQSSDGKIKYFYLSNGNYDFFEIAGINEFCNITIKVALPDTGKPVSGFFKVNASDEFGYQFKTNNGQYEVIGKVSLSPTVLNERVFPVKQGSYYESSEEGNNLENTTNQMENTTNQIQGQVESIFGQPEDKGEGTEKPSTKKSPKTPRKPKTPNPSKSGKTTLDNLGQKNYLTMTFEGIIDDFGASIEEIYLATEREKIEKFDKIKHINSEVKKILISKIESGAIITKSSLLFEYTQEMFGYISDDSELMNISLDVLKRYQDIFVNQGIS